MHTCAFQDFSLKQILICLFSGSPTVREGVTSAFLILLSSVLFFACYGENIRQEEGVNGRNGDKQKRRKLQLFPVSLL